ncbi:MAG TPA: hypothetical protein VL635_22390 [Trinickia sp.]|nr:hypothetical protein [Trinickia sp.]
MGKSSYSTQVPKLRANRPAKPANHSKPRQIGEQLKHGATINDLKYGKPRPSKHRGPLPEGGRRDARMAKLLLCSMTLHYFLGVGAELNAPAIAFTPDPRRRARPAPGPTEGAQPASDAGSSAAPTVVAPGPLSSALGSIRTQNVDPAANLDVAHPSNRTPGHAPGSVHPLELDTLRSKRNAERMEGHHAANMKTPIRWAADRPSLLSQTMFGTAPTREHTYRLAIKEKGLDPDKKYYTTDRWQTFSQNMNSANHRISEMMSHIELALDADTSPLPFMARRTENDLYFPGEALFNEAYRHHITLSKELGAKLVMQELSKYGVASNARVDFITIHGYTADSLDPIGAGRGFIFKVKGTSGSRYFAVTPLTDDMVFPIPESADLSDWIKHHSSLFFDPGTDLTSIRTFSTRTKEHHASLITATAYAVTPLVEHILNKLKRVAYGETELQEFVHMARGICDPTGIYDIKRALELEDYTTLALNVGAMLFPKARGAGGTAIKWVTKHSRWLKTFVKSKVWKLVKNAPDLIEDLIDSPVEQGLNGRSILGLNHGDQPDVGTEQSRTSDQPEVHLSHAAKQDQRAIDTLIRNDDWIQDKVINASDVDPLDAILHMNKKLLKAGYKTEVLAMLVWNAVGKSATEQPPKIHYAVTVRQFGSNQDFVIDAPIDSFDRFGLQGIYVLPLHDWETTIRDKAKHQIPLGIVKYRIFPNFREAQDTFQPSTAIASKTNLGDRTVVLHKRAVRTHKHAVTSRPNQP